MNAPHRSTALGALALCTTLVGTSPAWPGELAGCEEPLAEETLAALEFDLAFFSVNSIRAGSSRVISLGVVDCCYFLRPVTRCIEWSVEPEDAATIQPLPQIGKPPGAAARVSIHADAPHGTVVTVRADVESGRRVVTTPLHVYTLEGNPLVGYWTEAFQISCDEFVRGDVDQNGGLDISDPIGVFGHLFLGDEAPGCLQSADANRDGGVDISDGVYLLSFLFSGGQVPPGPFPDCGVDPGSPLGCQRFDRCVQDIVTPPVPILELDFRANGRFSVTWIPFEVYRDYWGTYVHDVETGRIELNVIGGNYVPPDVQCFGECSFQVIGDNRLVLENLWLGSPQGTEPHARCTHIFDRWGRNP